MLLLFFVTVNLVHCHQGTDSEPDAVQTNILLKKDILVNSFLNLHTIQQDFNDFNCLFIFNNYNNVDLKFDVFPIILRRLQTVLREDVSTKLSFSSRQIWIPHGLLNGKNKILLDGFPIIPCPMSRFLSPITNVYWSYATDFCCRINLPLFASSSKQWDCLADIHMSPPSKIFGLGFEYVIDPPRPFLQHKSHGFDKLETVAPSSRPSVNILIDLMGSITNQKLVIWVQMVGMPSRHDDSSPSIKYTDIIVYTPSGSDKWITKLVQMATYQVEEIQKATINVNKFIATINVQSDQNKNTVWYLNKPYGVKMKKDKNYPYFK